MGNEKMQQPKPATKKTAAATRKKRRSPDEIMALLTRAAAEEFKLNGFAGATTAAIARRAEVTEAQLFRYFPSKVDLFHEAIFEPLNTHFSNFNARYRNDELVGTEDFRDQAGLYINELREFLGEHSPMLMTLIVAQAYAAGSRKGVAEIEGLRTYFERGSDIMGRRSPANPRVRPELMVRVSFAAVLGCVMFNDWIFPKGLASEGEIEAAIIDFVIDGINATHQPELTAPAARKRQSRRKNHDPE